MIDISLITICAIWPLKMNIKQRALGMNGFVKNERECQISILFILVLIFAHCFGGYSVIS